MENIVRFAVKDNNNFYKIELSKTLLHFIEFDFTYFWEQCIEAGRSARKSGRLPQNVIANAKAVISKAHPYIEACINTDYSEIATDCIIEYICHSERIGLEELWARCISPKNLYETAIFRRISEYKTNRAANRWSSVVKLQEYARNKVDFIFSPDENQSVIENETFRVRKEYFDLAVSVAANELGCPENSLPTVKIYSPANLPNAAFAISKVAKGIYRRFSEVLAQAQDMSKLKNTAQLGDQLSMEAYGYIKNMPRPGELDMKFALETIRNNPPLLYMPDSLKAAIDLEFELMYQCDVVFRKCENCGRYFTAKDDNTRCDRVNSSGKTCRRQYEELCEAIALETAKANEEEMRRKQAQEEELRKQQEALLREAETEIQTTLIPDIPEPPKPVPAEIPKETEKRGQKLYNALYKRVNRGFDENEFREWSQYLSNMKRNLKIGEATLAQFEEFLDYSDKLYEEVKIAAKNKTNYEPEEKPYGNGGKGKTKKKSTSKKAKAKEEPQLTSVISSENVDVKPFTPQTFDTLMDAVAAFEEEDGEENSPKKKPVEVKAPQWERLTREDAYGKNDKGEN
ncbi:MAG: hypothetical protein NC253_02145 [Ruminococcus sp.]|nr:hypothetical protein [Ruminococcus sp.]MCM1380446.1 hypothetical protein [Muribaculaceae bacterium]MCM1480651.1 hypothetical protein [Muribaculaceae bacterium]